MLKNILENLPFIFCEKDTYNHPFCCCADQNPTILNVLISLNPSNSIDTRINHQLIVYNKTFHVKLPMHHNMPINCLFSQVLFTICFLEAPKILESCRWTHCLPYKSIFPIFLEIKLLNQMISDRRNVLKGIF